MTFFTWTQLQQVCVLLNIITCQLIRLTYINWGYRGGLFKELSNIDLQNIPMI